MKITVRTNPGDCKPHQIQVHSAQGRTIYQTSFYDFFDALSFAVDLAIQYTADLDYQRIRRFVCLIDIDVNKLDWLHDSSEISDVCNWLSVENLRYHNMWIGVDQNGITAVFATDAYSPTLHHFVERIL